MLAALVLTIVSFVGIVQPPVGLPASGAPPAAAPPATKSPATRSMPKHMEWTVDGVKREGVVYLPADATTKVSPLIFAFHGHGGNARYAAAKFELQKSWPEAIVVYMQGLPAPGKTDPEGKKNGWQKGVGELEDRDLKFFDAVLAQIRKDYKVDDSRIYAMGHSNGGMFTYLLWEQRGETFAAVAPASAGSLTPSKLKAKPAMVIGGDKDEVVPFEFQTRTMEGVRKVNGCDAEGKTWAKDCLMYASKTGTPFVSMIYHGGHAFAEEAPPLIVRFFKEQVKAGGTKGDEPKPGGDAKPAPAAPLTR